MAARAAAAARGARRAGVQVGARSVVGARVVAAAARRARPEAGTSAPDAHLAGPEDLAELAEQAEATALAGLEEVIELPRPASCRTSPSCPTSPRGRRGRHRGRRGLGALHGAPRRRRPRPAPCRPGAPPSRPRSSPPSSSPHRAAMLTGSDTRRRPTPPPRSPSRSASPRPWASRAPRRPRWRRRGTAGRAGLQPGHAGPRAVRRRDHPGRGRPAGQRRYAALAAEAARPKAVLPVQGARLTSGFGARWGTLHAGIDLAAPMLTPEYAAMDGVVLEAGPASGYGNAVYIQHDNGDVTVYGHMEQILVQPGQVVRAGDTIALLGNRGQSTGPHLHFEVHVGGLNGTKVDPIPWLRERGVQI